ncbi:hypothetical protein PPL_10949 [Heterostelium album PN500]|uniref:Uncharacterized protein n=1 Tax=Heterostelium pallidum (strain ATCC 26659 / Pp 5 / PN500) TaxID=670386 RepID=D3BSI1_HETP5|nr:hypothetical protein PPL_10949 [Heterostelium album PN500]EFA75639.1 hypothetical protein PPL_10949 [Heterostelium album PN500]|eukprot:XP_020427773.1 hypothetical protein PPL_10949 [Heterostelium album PN500]
MIVYLIKQKKCVLHLNKTNYCKIHPGNALDHVLASSNDGCLYRIKISTRDIVNSVMLINSIPLVGGQVVEQVKTTGYLDEKNGYLYYAYSNYNNNNSITLLKMQDKSFRILSSIDLSDQSGIPFIDKSLFLDNDGIIYLFTSNNIYKIQSDPINHKFYIIDSYLYPDYCLFALSVEYDPSTLQVNGKDGSIFLGCLSDKGLILQLSLSDFSLLSLFNYTDGDSIMSMTKSSSSLVFIGGSGRGGAANSESNHLISLQLTEDGKLTSSITVITSTKLSVVDSTTSASDGVDSGAVGSTGFHALFALGSDILLYNLNNPGDEPLDADLLANHQIGVSSTYSKRSSVVLLSTNSSSIYFYKLPAPFNIPPDNSLPIWVLLFVLAAAIVLIIFLSKVIKTYYQIRDNYESID